MRKYLGAIGILAAALSVTLGTPAHSAVPPQVTADLLAHPTGGPGLTAAIVAYMDAQPSFAQAYAQVTMVMGENPAQRLALAQAYVISSLYFAQHPGCHSPVSPYPCYPY